MFTRNLEVYVSVSRIFKTAETSHRKEVSQQRKIKATKHHSKEVSQPRSLAAKKFNSKSFPNSVS